MKIEYYTIRVTTETEKFETIRHTEEGMKDCLKALRLGGYENITVYETIDVKGAA